MEIIGPTLHTQGCLVKRQKRYLTKFLICSSYYVFSIHFLSPKIFNNFQSVFKHFNVSLTYRVADDRMRSCFLRAYGTGGEPGVRMRRTHKCVGPRRRCVDGEKYASVCASFEGQSQGKSGGLTLKYDTSIDTGIFKVWIFWEILAQNKQIPFAVRTSIFGLEERED